MTLDEAVRAVVREEFEALKAELEVRPLELPEVAEHLGVSIRQVKRLMARSDRRNRLYAFNVGDGDERGDWRVDRRELERWKREARR